MTWFRVRDTHPAKDALEEIFELMDRLKISIHINDSKLTVIHEGSVYTMLDLEKSPDNIYGDSGIYCLPPQLEYKLCYEKDDAKI